MRARVRLLARVRPRVAPQIGHLHEGFVAILAGEGPLAGVQADVRFKMVVARESLATVFANERLLARVRSFVVLQNMLVAETLVALFAGELFARCCGACALDHNR